MLLRRAHLRAKPDIEAPMLLRRAHRRAKPDIEAPMLLRRAHLWAKPDIEAPMLLRRAHRRNKSTLHCLHENNGSWETYCKPYNIIGSVIRRTHRK